MVTTKRYQECGLVERLWRRRHYLRVPFEAASDYRRDPEFFDCSFANAWSCAIGMAEVRMRWWYTVDECREMFR